MLLCPYVTMSSLANKPGTKSFRVIWAAALRLIHKCSSNTDIAVENELEQLVSTASNTSDNVLSTLLTFADEQGDTLLHHAARAHCVRALAWLLKQGASPHVMNRRGKLM
jgi:ankyrin repeat protein